MSWRVAHSLTALAEELDAVFPDRTKPDWFVGDASHASRVSDHNPWVYYGDSIYIVTGADYRGTLVARRVVDTLVTRKHHRLKYVIHNRTIWRSYSKGSIAAWAPAPYAGANGHLTHVHVSVKPDSVLYDDTSSWGIASGSVDIGGGMSKPGGDFTMALKRGSSGATVRTLQGLLNATKLVKVLEDGIFGSGTETALKKVQTTLKLKADGEYGPATQARIVKYLGEITPQTGRKVCDGVVVGNAVVTFSNSAHAVMKIAFPKDAEFKGLPALVATPGSDNYTLGRWSLSKETAIIAAHCLYGPTTGHLNISWQAVG